MCFSAVFTTTFLCAIPPTFKHVRLLKAQDLTGGAARIFIQHPDNPPINQMAGSSQSGSARSTKAGPDKGNGNVEDALALGNSARDDKPPRYNDAERAYRLAARLDARDPRPYTGLGNVMYDQHRYIEAADMYRRALSLLPAALRKGNGERRVVIGQRVSTPAGDWYAFLGSSLLKQNNLAEAEAEFLNAVRVDSKNAKWHALLGYTYLLEGQFEVASKSFEAAIRLAPADEAYKELLKLAKSRSEIRN